MSDTQTPPRLPDALRLCPTGTNFSPLRPTNSIIHYFGLVLLLYRALWILCLANGTYINPRREHAFANRALPTLSRSHWWNVVSVKNQIYRPVIHRVGIQSSLRLNISIASATASSRVSPPPAAIQRLHPTRSIF